MKSCRTILLLLCITMPGLSTYPQEKIPGVQIVKPQDLKRTAYRLRISVDRLVNARTALKEATDLALRADADAPDNYGSYGSLAGLWIQIDRKKAREMIGTMILDLSSHAQAAENLDSYRNCTSRAQQLLGSLNEIDPEHALQIAQLWPAPAAKLGSAGEQALAQFQNDLNSRIMSQAVYSSPDLIYEQLQQPQKAAALPLALRIQVAQSLINSNQKEKARAVLDQAIAEMGRRPLVQGQRYDYDSFLGGLARLYPDRMLEAFSSYQEMLAGLGADANQGMVIQAGEQRVWLSAAESTALNVARGLYNRPELALKILDSVPGLRNKFDQLGGLDNVLSPGSGGLAPGPQVLSYAASYSDGSRIMASPPARPSDNASDPPPNPSQVFQSLRGKAENNPEMVRRKLQDTFRKKEHFPNLISLAQMANNQDPDLSSIALQVARGLLPQFENLQQRAANFRNLISTVRSCEGEIDSGLLKQGMSLANELREEEKSKEQANPPGPNARVYRPSDDFEIALIGQTAVDDFSAALRSAHAMESDTLRIRALVQITQNLMSSY
jgi:hypothetical protein